MSFAMYLGETDSQTSSMNELCNDVMQAMEEMDDSIDYFLGASLLQGKTYQSAKIYMSITYRPIIQGTIYLCEELIRQNSKYPGDFRSEVSGADVIETEIQEQIKEIEIQIDNYKTLAEISPLQSFPIIGLQLLKASLQKKLEDLYTFNTTSSTNYDIALEYSQSISTGINQILFHSHFNIMTGKFSTEGMDTSFISDIKDTHYKRRALDEYAEYLDEHSDSNPDVLNDVIEVLRYEDEHPEDATAVNEMLEPLDKKDRQEIKVILYSAEEPYRTLAVQYADRVELNRVEIVDEDDIPPSSYSNHSNTIHYVYEKDRENTRGAYYSFFHELGHAIDYNYGADIQNEENWLGRKTGDDAFYSEFHTQNGTTLAEKMHTDFKNEIGSSIQEEVNAPPYASFSDAKKEQITENILANLTNRDKYFNALSEDEQDIQMAIEDKYEEILHGPENSLASDTYGGVTDKTIKGQFNHGDDYWYNWLGFRKREPNREGFAEYYARQVLYSDEHNDKGIKSAEELLPTSKEMMDEMFESMQRK